jgi:DNA-binding NarL/FixJ family response regulator
MTSIRVVVVDDHDVVRAGFAAIIGGEVDMTVVGSATRGDDAIRVVRRTTPDVVLMDVRMPGMDGIEAVRRIASDPDLKEVRVIVLTT